MTNLLERAISTDDANRAGKIIQDALGWKTQLAEMILRKVGEDALVNNQTGPPADPRTGGAYSLANGTFFLVQRLDPTLTGSAAISPACAGIGPHHYSAS
jgi:hypothetical protein